MGARYACLILLSVMAAGCNDDPTAPPPPVSESFTWIGSFTEGGVRGALNIHLVKTKNDVAGELVITRVPDLNASAYLFVTGTWQGEAIHLELDSNRAPYQYTFTLDADADSSLGLLGTIAYPVAGLYTSFTSWSIPERAAPVRTSYLVPTSVRSMVWDGTLLWLSTYSDDFVRFNSQGVFQDQVVVFYSGDIHWTSAALTHDGTHLLGFLPTVIAGPGGTINASRMYEFDASGIQREFVLPHRTAGLAYDGTYYWSLDSQSRHLVRFDAGGAISDSVEIDLPDPHHLEFADGHFWALGWYSMRLFKVGMDGTTLAVYDVPRTLPGPVLTAIAVEGSFLWYSEDVDPNLEESRIYKLQPE